MLAQVQEQKGKSEGENKISQILKNATERQCFGQFMRISKITATDDYNQTISSKTVHEVCANGLLMLKAGVTNGSMTFSLYGYIADDADILKVYEALGVDPYYRIKCNRCNSHSSIDNTASARYSDIVLQKSYQDVRRVFRVQRPHSTQVEETASGHSNC